MKQAPKIVEYSRSLYFVDEDNYYYYTFNIDPVRIGENFVFKNKPEKGMKTLNFFWFILYPFIKDKIYRIYIAKHMTIEQNKEAFKNVKIIYK